MFELRLVIDLTTNNPVKKSNALKLSDLKD